MTEADWLAATHPAPMLGFLRGEASDRKLRLFAVAALNHPDIEDKVWIHRLEVTGLFADGLAGVEMVRSAWGIQLGGCAPPERIHEWVNQVVPVMASINHFPHFDPKKWRQWAIVCTHEIFGNPFSPPHFDPSFRTSTVLALAARMYASRDFTLMPMLADALQDAGCPDDSPLLSHCRGPGPHVRGCHVLDGILGKS